MLGKLLKYEFRATARLFLPFFGAILLMGAVNRLFFAFDILESRADWVSVLAMVVYILLIFATFLLSYVVMIGRFYKNLLGREGYLMHTLPVRPRQHIVCKALISLLWSAGSLLSTVISVFIMVSSRDFYRAVIELMGEVLPFLQSLGGHAPAYAAEILALCILSSLAGMLMIYACIALGQLMPGHRLLGAFVAYIIITTVLQFFGAIFTVALEFIDPEFFRQLETADLKSILHAILGGGILLALAECAAFFGITNHMLSRRLNLE